MAVALGPITQNRPPQQDVRPKSTAPASASLVSSGKTVATGSTVSLNRSLPAPAAK